MNCTVCPASGADQHKAQRVASDLELPYANRIDAISAAVALVVDAQRSWLQRAAEPKLGPVYVDFASAAMLHRRRAGHNEPIGRAVGVKAERQPRVLDATAGLGRDAFVLADLGCSVTLCEELSPVAYLLTEAVTSGMISSVEKVRVAAERMQVICADSRELDATGFDVIYLDPMFPSRTKAAAVKKDLATLQALRSDRCQDAEAHQLLDWSMAQAISRVVVKRPVKAPVLGNSKPSHSITGRTIRYDVYVS